MSDAVVCLLLQHAQVHCFYCVVFVLCYLTGALLLPCFSCSRCRVHVVVVRYSSSDVALSEGAVGYLSSDGYQASSDEACCFCCLLPVSVFVQGRRRSLLVVGCLSSDGAYLMIVLFVASLRRRRSLFVVG